MKVGLAETKSEVSKQGTLASHTVLVNLLTALAAEYEDSFSFEFVVDPVRRLVAEMQSHFDGVISRQPTQNDADGYDEAAVKRGELRGTGEKSQV